MYRESLFFDPISQQNEEKGIHLTTTCATNFSMGLQQLDLEMATFHSTLNCNNNDQIENNEFGQPNLQEIGFNAYHQQQGHQLLQNFPNSSSLIHSNPSNLLTPSSLGLLASTSTNLFYDPQLNLCTQQPTLFKELFPHGGGSLYSHHGVAHEAEGVFYHDDGSFQELSEDIKKRDQLVGKDHMKHHATEKQRRVHFSDKFQALRSLIPNPSKNDRATIIADAIGYINELKMTVNELKNRVELKKERIIKRQRREEGCVFNNMEGDDDSTVPLRCSCKSKNAQVDVRIIDDEVTVKLVQQQKKKKRMNNNCLLFVSKVFDELELDLHHVSGGLIGDHYSYLFNSKICEGCRMYASAVANKIIQVILDKEEDDDDDDAIAVDQAL